MYNNINNNQYILDMLYEIHLLIYHNNNSININNNKIPIVQPNFDKYVTNIVEYKNNINDINIIKNKNNK